MNIAVGDKNLNLSVIVKETIREISGKYQIPVDISLFTSGTELLLDKNKFDIIFMDTDMNDISGIQIADCIRITDNTKKLIFMSDNDELVFQVLKYQPYRFIRKKYLHTELNEAVQSLFKPRKNSGIPFICNNKNKKITVYTNEILFFEIFGHDIEIHTVTAKFHITGTLNKIQNQLEPSGFIRIHKSYLVNSDHIIGYTSKNVTMQDMTVLPVSKYRYGELKNQLKNAADRSLT